MMILILTLAVNKVGQVQIQFANGHVYVIRIHAQPRFGALGILLQPLAIRALQWNRLEQDHHDEIKAPHLVRLPQAVDASHLTLLVRVRVHTDRVAALARDALHKVLPALLRYVLPQFAQQPRRPFLLDFRLLVLRRGWSKDTTEMGVFT